MRRPFPLLTLLPSGHAIGQGCWMCYVLAGRWIPRYRLQQSEPISRSERKALIRRLFLTFNLNFYFLAMLHYVYIFTLFTVTPAIQEQACHAGRLPSLPKSAKTHTSNKVSYIHPLDKFTLPQRGNFLRAQKGGGGGGSSGFATLR